MRVKRSGQILAENVGHNSLAIKAACQGGFQTNDFSRIVRGGEPVGQFAQFSAGQLRTQRVRLLVEYCERRNVQEFLLAQVQKINLARYAEYEEHTRKTTGTLDSLLNQGLDAGMDALTDRPEPLDEAIHKLRE